MPPRKIKTVAERIKDARTYRFRKGNMYVNCMSNGMLEDLFTYQNEQRLIREAKE